MRSALNVLSNPSKMPCRSTSLPAYACKTGSKLRKIPGSVCADCYACKGCYRFPSTVKAMDRRLSEIYRAGWVDTMVTAIQRERTLKSTDGRYFRWHDSGDLQSVAHLRRIVEVCERTPTVNHWIPTREHTIVREYLRTVGPFPSNLVVRLSVPMVDGPIPRPNGVLWSGVHSTRKPAVGAKACRAYTRDGHCGRCRACWNPTVPFVSYPLH